VAGGALAAEDAAREEHQPLREAAEVVITGGGFTGLWTAIRLQEHHPDLPACVLEAHYCGCRASGRNGGIAEASRSARMATASSATRSRTPRRIQPGEAVSFTLQEQLDSVLGTLSERETGVVSMRFGLTDAQLKTPDEIGKLYGVTRERTRQIESKTMSKLRRPGHDIAGEEHGGTGRAYKP